MNNTDPHLFSCKFGNFFLAMRPPTNPQSSAALLIVLLSVLNAGAIRTLDGKSRRTDSPERGKSRAPDSLPGTARPRAALSPGCKVLY